MFRSVFKAPRVIRQGLRQTELPAAGFPRLFHAGLPSRSATTVNSPNRRNDEDPLPPTFMEKYKLYEPTRWVPLTAGAFIAASQLGFYHWDPESQMAAVFLLFVVTLYNQAGGIIAKDLDDELDQRLKYINDAEDVYLKKLKTRMTTLEKFGPAEVEFKALAEANQKLAEDLEKAVPMSFMHKKVDFFQRKLDRIASYEAEARENLQQELIKKATEEVTETFSKDSKLASKSLGSAISFLGAKPDQQKEPQEVGDLYKKFFSKMKTNSAITKDLEEKMKKDLDKLMTQEQFLPADEYEFLTQRG